MGYMNPINYEQAFITALTVAPCTLDGAHETGGSPGGFFHWRDLMRPFRSNPSQRLDLRGK